MKSTSLVILLVSAVGCGVVCGIFIQKGSLPGKMLRALNITYRNLAESREHKGSFPTVPQEYVGKLSIFVLAGQSNMVGMGDLQSRDLPGNGTRVFMFGADYRWRAASEPVHGSVNCVDPISKNENAGSGPALAFAKQLLKLDPDLIVGLVPCAKEGSTILEWEKNLTDESLYGACLKRTRAASCMGRIAGLLFFQGEADTFSEDLYPGWLSRPASAPRWADKFSKFVQDFRHDTGLSDLVVVFAQIGSTNTPELFADWALVQKQQSSVRLASCAMITTDDLPMKDGVHFSTEGYDAIGVRFAEAYWKIRRP